MFLCYNIYLKTYVSTRNACKILDYTPDPLRRLANAGKIECIRTEGGQRRYNVDAFIQSKTEATLITVCDCRVSSVKQKDALERQVNFMRSLYPDAEVIGDIGSGLNCKRKGLRSILERIVQGDKLQVVVAHGDRLPRFGNDLIAYLLEQNGGELVVLDDTACSPEEEITQDILTILHVFSSRLHGLRKYRDKIKEDKDLSDC